MMAATVGEALEEFYAKEGLDGRALNDFWVFANFPWIKVPYPNFKPRRDMMYLHDSHHLLKGFDTSFAGEGEVAAFELASGFPLKYWIGYLYAPFSFVIGLLVAPRRTLNAFRLGLGRKNACDLDLAKAEFLSLPVTEFKTRLGFLTT